MRVVILTCEKYKWMVGLFMHFHNKYWPDNPYGIDVIADAENVDATNVFYTKGVSWASGILNYVAKSKDDKFLLLPEDYVIKSTVNTGRVKQAEALCTGNIGCVRLNAPDKYFHRHAHGSGIKFYKEYPLDKPYSLSMQAAIWQRQYIFDVFRHKEDAWQTEIDGSIRLKGMVGRWRILWPKSAIIDYQAGGIMVRGRPRMEVVKWTLLDLIKGG